LANIGALEGSAVEPKCSNISRILADNLLHLRKHKGGTQKSVAQEIGWSRQTLTFLESGLGNPSLWLIAKIAEYYQVKIDDLLQDPYDKFHIFKSRGSILRSSLSAPGIQADLILSHSNSVRYRDFILSESGFLRLKARDNDSKELLVCREGGIVVESKLSTERLLTGQYFELIPRNEIRIRTINEVAAFVLIEFRKMN
jgi:DNA-binding XRE family transcriptional regulator